MVFFYVIDELWVCYHFAYNSFSVGVGLIGVKGPNGLNEALLLFLCQVG